MHDEPVFNRAAFVIEANEVEIIKIYLQKSQDVDGALRRCVFTFQCHGGLVGAEDN